MNAQQFLTWMRNPGQTSREESAQLDALLDAFPYFQSGHLLYIKNLHNQGSFLYNNQLKTAAAYAVNRKVLYELITLKSGVVSSESGVKPAPELKTAEISTTSSEKVVEAKTEEIAEPIKFPPKKFTKDPDEWEAGMLRQLQLLHHWKKTGVDTGLNVSGSGLNPPGPETKVPVSEEKHPASELKAEEKSEQPVSEVPAAKEEINTLLYVLVEPGQSEDLPEEVVEEATAEPIGEEGEITTWEITTPEVKAEIPVEVPSDPIQQEIIVEAIHSTFELEVDDTLPSVDDLKTIRTEQVDEKPLTEEKEAVKVVETRISETVPAPEETVVTSFENMSFSDWLKEVSKKVPAPLPKTVLSEDRLIEDFIHNEPRINVKKSGFYNPVNMAKKSVQESDEFITETLARIYAKQGNHTKAIRAYQKLSLKFPEKTAYFAALIEELKRTPNK